MSQISDNNYYVISGWMINKLDLSNTELMVFAIIYGFCQNDRFNGSYHGSLQYLADFTGTTKQTIIKVLKSLTAKKYIEKSESYQNNVKFCTYKINTTVVENLTGSKESLMGSKESLPGGGKKSLMGGGKESLPNNKSLDNESLNNINKKTKKTDFDILIDEYTCNDKLKESIYEFIKMRKANKKPLTPYGLKKILNKLDTLATDDDSKIQILDKSIERSWGGVFELKDNKGDNSNGGTQQPPKPEVDVSSMTFEELEEYQANGGTW